MQKLQVYVDDELWVLDVTDTEFQAATSGDEKLVKFLVAKKSERRSMAVINELQADKPEEPADASQANEARKESFVWPDQAVLLFLETYRDKEPDFALGLKRHNKIWMEIANDMKMANYNVTAAQCQNKMSGLQRTYKNISDSNNKSGNHSSSWAFYSVMDSIFGDKAWVAPASIASSDGPPSPGSSSSTFSEKFAIDDPKPKKRRVESILESFITEIKEDKQKEREDKEQRRAEKKQKRKRGGSRLDKRSRKCTKTECWSSSL